MKPFHLFHPCKRHAETWSDLLKREVHLIDRVVMVVSVLSPMMTIPQIWRIFDTQDASSLSLWTWGLYAVMALPFLLYALAHKATPLVVNALLWMVVYTVMLTGIVLYS